ncbi:MAG: cytidine deaminase [Acidobacteriota bacterium]
MDRLEAAALEARQRARAPFSGFLVGAALEEEDGRIFTGCNVESASYGLTMCAERVAAFRAVADGGRRFVRIAVATDSKTLTPPCGACRQVLWELCGDVEILLLNLDGARETMRLSTLLPRPFDATFLD